VVELALDGKAEDDKHSVIQCQTRVSGFSVAGVVAAFAVLIESFPRVRFASL